MSERVFVLLEIPFVGWDGQPDSIAFDCWLPLMESDTIVVNEGDKSLILRFTPSCTHSPELCSAENLPRWGNASVCKVIAETCLTNVSEEVIQGILKPDYSNLSQEWLMNNCHRAFASEIVNWVLGYVNRLVSYASNQKGQYNLAELSLDADNLHTALIRFNARAKVGNSEWTRWNPPGIGGIWRYTGYAKDREIRVQDWPTAKNYITSSGRPPLVRELLARADFLSAHGHERAALTEAVTALEVAIHRFARRPNAQAAFGPILAMRMDVPLLQKQIARLGLNCTIKYLLPVILPEDKLPTEILQGCREAVESAKASCITEIELWSQPISPTS